MPSNIMDDTPYNARYKKLIREIRDIDLDISYLVWGRMPNFSLLGSRADLLSYGMSQKKIICKSLVDFLCITFNQSNVLALYV